MNALQTLFFKLMTLLVLFLATGCEKEAIEFIDSTTYKEPTPVEPYTPPTRIDEEPRELFGDCKSCVAYQNEVNIRQ